jgi:hypothetical protein
MLCLISHSTHAAPENSNRNGLYIGFYRQFPLLVIRIVSTIKDPLMLMG